MFNSSAYKLWQVKLKFFLWPIYSKQTYSYSQTQSMTGKSIQKNLQPEFQISHYDSILTMKMKTFFQRKLFRQINKVIIAKTNKLKKNAFWRARPKSKYQCLTSTEIVIKIWKDGK